MNSSLNTVVHLDVKLWKGIVLISGGLSDISKGGSIDNVSDDESLDGLILWDGLSGGDTSNSVDVSSSVLVSSVVSSLDSHGY